MFFQIFRVEISFSLVLHLYPEKGVDRPFIYLEDIGTLTKEKTDYFINEKTILMSLPSKPFILSAAKLQEILVKKLHQRVNIVGNEIKIYPLYTSILIGDVTEKIKDALKSKYPYLGHSHIVISYLKFPELEKIPAGIKNIQVFIPGGRLNLVKYVRLNVIGYYEEIKSVSFPIKLTVFANVLVANRNLLKGSLIKKKDFSIRRKKIVEDIYVTESNFFSFINQPLKVNLHKNKPLLLEFIKN